MGTRGDSFLRFGGSLHPVTGYRVGNVGVQYDATMSFFSQFEVWNQSLCHPSTFFEFNLLLMCNSWATSRLISLAEYPK